MKTTIKTASKITTAEARARAKAWSERRKEKKKKAVVQDQAADLSHLLHTLSSLQREASVLEDESRQNKTLQDLVRSEIRKIDK